MYSIPRAATRDSQILTVGGGVYLYEFVEFGFPLPRLYIVDNIADNQATLALDVSELLGRQGLQVFEVDLRDVLHGTGMSACDKEMISRKGEIFTLGPVAMISLVRCSRVPRISVHALVTRSWKSGYDAAISRLRSAKRGSRGLCPGGAILELKEG